MVTHDRQLDWIGDTQEGEEQPLGPTGSYLMGGLKVWIDYGQVVGLEKGP